MKHFSRAALATQLADNLQGKNPFQDFSNGLFLAAPRRTGKTVFLRHDLTPVLLARNLVAVYVDLWSDRNKDPAHLIAEAIGIEIRNRLGVVAKAAQSSGMSALQIGGLQFDTSKIGKPDGSTLANALQYLAQLSKSAVVLIVDEAQQALSSPAGQAAMAGLKSARDQMNKPGDPQLMLVMSGSDRDKLLRLVNGNSSPFLGSTIHPMPVLGEDFIEFVCQSIHWQYPTVQPDRQNLLKAFALFDHKPPTLLEAVADIFSPLSQPSEDFDSDIITRAQAHHQDEQTALEHDFSSLSILEQAVLVHMLEVGENFRPYNTVALKAYEKLTGVAVNQNQAQRAVENLRTKENPLVWKSSRGEYVMENSAMRSWFEEHKKNGTWPPMDISKSASKKTKSKPSK